MRFHTGIWMLNSVLTSLLITATSFGIILLSGAFLDLPNGLPAEVFGYAFFESFFISRLALWNRNPGRSLFLIALFGVALPTVLFLAVPSRFSRFAYPLIFADGALIMYQSYVAGWKRMLLSGNNREIRGASES